MYSLHNYELVIMNWCVCWKQKKVHWWSNQKVANQYASIIYRSAVF